MKTNVHMRSEYEKCVFFRGIKINHINDQMHNKNKNPVVNIRMHK